MILLLIDDVNIVRTVKDKLETVERKNKAEVEAAKKKVAVAEKKFKEEEVSVAATKDEVKNQKEKKLKRIRKRMTRRVSSYMMLHWLNLLDSCALGCDCCSSESTIPDTEYF